jgi:sigma-B regulation protein RsbU (phosphoserine phosphatase)
MDAPLAFRYQQALDEFRQGGCAADVVVKRMSELIALLDLTTSLGGWLSGQEILDAVLLTVMGRLGASQGCLYVRTGGGVAELRVARGLQGELPRSVALDELSGVEAVERGSGRLEALFATTGLELLCPITRAGRPVAVVGVGPSAGGRRYTREDLEFVRSVAACAATPVENGLIQDELRQVNRRLSVKIYQLRNLFDISRELAASFDEESIKSLTVTTIMGHLMVSRCALFLMESGALGLAHARGLQFTEGAALVPREEAQRVLGVLDGPLRTEGLPAGELRSHLAEHGLAQLIPLNLGGSRDGFVALGDRPSGAPFSDEDHDFVLTLGRQALAALENVRLQRVRLEKQRQDRELQIAREIQRSLFPTSFPTIPGYSLAAEMRPCYEVGGDYYDAIPIGRDRWALLIADVSGKGVPASILMASLHASLHALAGAASPSETIGRLNRFLYESTQPSRFATLFYCELDAAAGRLSYVNAGHVPPFHIPAAGPVRRLETGGPALGLIEDAGYELGVAELAPGDLVAMVTDGATEARSASDEEFGDQRVLESIAGGRGVAADRQVDALFANVQAWAGEAGCADDLTALILEVCRAT